jgi:hypothetical protein
MAALPPWATIVYTPDDRDEFCAVTGENTIFRLMAIRKS